MGVPRRSEIALRITYRSQTCRPETAYYREAAAWLSEKTRNKLIHICSPGYSKTVSKTDLERALFEALQAAVAWDAAEHSDDMGRRAT